VRVTDVPEAEGFRLEATTAVELVFCDVTLKALDVEVLLAEFPAYTAVTLLAATVVKVAAKVVVRVNPVPDKVPVPRVVAPFINVTVPVGPVPDAATTVAVSVLGLPTATGLTLAVTVVVVVLGAAVTTWLSAVEVLVLLSVSPA
jgi:hypothetical protein